MNPRVGSGGNTLPISHSSSHTVTSRSHEANYVSPTVAKAPTSTSSPAEVDPSANDWPSSRWLGVRTDTDVFDDDFLESLPYPCTTTGLPDASNGEGDGSNLTAGGSMAPGATAATTGSSASLHASGATPQKTASTSNNVRASDFDMSLWMASVDGSVLLSHADKMLAMGLSRQCRRADVFSRRVTRQLFALQNVHCALTSFSSRIEHLITTTMQSAATSDIGQKDTTDAVRADGDAAAESSKAHDLGYGAQLGVSLFFTLLECVSDVDSTLEERRAFLHDLTPIVTELEPESFIRKLAVDASSDQSASVASSSHSLGILDALRDFLFSASLPSVEECPILVTDGILSQKEIAVAGRLDLSDRTDAVTSLIALACLRGSLPDLLMAVKVLLCVCWSPHGEPVAAATSAKRPSTSDTQQNTSASESVTINLKVGKTPLPQSVDVKLDLRNGKEALRNRKIGKNALAEDVMEREEQLMIEYAASEMHGVEAYRMTTQQSSETFLTGASSALEAGSSVELNDSKMPAGGGQIQESNIANETIASSAEFSKKQQLLLEAKQRNAAIVPGGSDSSKHYHDWISPLSNICGYLQQLEVTKCQPMAAGSQALGAGMAQEREVWTFGQNSYGELVQGDTVTRKVPCRVTAVDEKSIVRVAAGNEHTVLLTADGTVYTAGYNDNGQCGQGSTERVGKLTPVDELRGHVVTQIHAYNGCEHTLAVTQEGQLFSFGYNYRGQLGQGTTSSIFSPRLVRGLESKKVVTVSCSYYHSVLSCAGGEIYAFGRNDFGQLGLGDSTDRKEPARVELPTGGEGARSIGCGQYHTMIATANGQAFAFGKNDYGQLGFAGNESQRRPVLLEAPIFEDSGVAEFRCGYYHTLCLLNSSHVFAFGRNDYGQLGLGHTTQRVFGPQLVETLVGKDIIGLSTGCYHSVAIANSGALYVFGRNNHGQLGTGDDAERHTPWLIGTFTGKRVGMVASGFYHTIVLTGNSTDGENGEGDEDDSLPQSAAGLLALPRYKLPTRNLVSEDSALKEVKYSSPNTTMSPKPHVDPENGGVSPTPFSLVSRGPRSMRHGGSEDPASRDPVIEHDKHKLDGSGNRDVIAPDSSAETPDIDPEHAAIFIMGHLDRLAASYIPHKNDLPSLYSPANPLRSSNSIAANEDGEHLGSFCVDVRPETFALLLSFFSLTGYEDPNCDVQKSTRPQIVLACLRLLRANLAKLIRSGRVHEGMESVLKRLKEKLLEMIQNPRHVIGQSKSKLPSSVSPVLVAIQRESAAVLIVGLQLFYPDAEDVVKLFSDLMSSSESSVATPQLTVTLATFLLSPLAKRLQEDSMIVFLFMNPKFDRPPSDGASKKCATSKNQPITVLTSALLRRIADDGNAAVVAALANSSEELSGENEKSDNSESPGNDEVDVISLTLALQKHILSFAGRDTPAEVVGAIEKLACLEYVFREEGFDASQNQPSATEPQNAGLKVLMTYTEEMVERCMEIVTQIVTWSEDTPSTRGSGQIWKSLRRSPVGRILPSLVTGLILFSENHRFAVKFLPQFASLLALLDRLLSINADVLALEQASMQNLDESFDGQQNNHRRQMIELNVENPSSLNAKPFDWLVDLEKTIAVLTSRMAATLLTGKSLAQERFRQASGAYAVSTSIPLCFGGLEDSVIQNMEKKKPIISSYGVVGGYLARLSEQLSGRLMTSKIELEPEDELTQIIMSWTKGLGLCKQERSAFIKSFLLSDSPSMISFVDWLRRDYASGDPKYTMALLQMRRVNGATAAMEEIERATAVAVFKHAGLLPDVMGYFRLALNDVEILKKIKVPKRILLAWKASADVRQWVLRERLKSSRTANGDEVGCSFESLCKKALSSAKCLLLFRPVYKGSRLLSSPADPFTAGFTSTVAGNASAARFDGLPFLRRYPRSRWRSVRVRVFVLIRWRKLTASGVNSSIRGNDTEEVMKKVSSMVTNCTSGNGENAADLLYSAIVSSEVAASRAAGLLSFERLLDAVQLVSLKSEIISTLGPAIRDSDATGSYVFSKLELGNNKIRRAVWHTFTSLFTKLSSTLLKSSSSFERISANEARLMSSIMDAWGLRIGTSSLMQNFVLKTSVLNIVRKLAFDSKGIKVAGNELEDLTPLWCTNPAPLPRNAMQHSQLYSWLPFVKECAWRLYRYIIVQLSGDPHEAIPDIALFDFEIDATVISPKSALYDMFYEDASIIFGRFRERQDKMLASVNAPIMEESFPAIEAGTPPQYPRMAHSQDIIDSPYHLSSDKSGLVVPAAKVLPNSSTGDFSLTFWILLTQDSTGNGRLVLLRGNHNDCSPLVALNPNDRTIEVIISQNPSIGSGNGGSNERLPSKSALPLHRWTHVSVVSEAAQLRLYVNGVLDAQRTNYTGVYRKSSSARYPIYVGKLPSSMPDLSPLKEGMEGAIAKLRYHSRALSPIHVRVDCEKGPPAQEVVSDKHCYQMYILLWLSSQSPVVLRLFSQRRWIEFLLNGLKFGTHRLRQTASRILRELIPVVNPYTMSTLLDTPKEMAAVSVINRLMDIVGHGLWFMQETYVVDGEHKYSRFPSSLFHKGLVSPTGGSMNGKRQSFSEITNCVFNLSSEVISLLRRLAKSHAWGPNIEEALKNAINNWQKTLCKEESALDSADEVKAVRALAAISILGGHIEGSRIGGRVALSHTNLSATVLSFDCDINTAAATQTAMSAQIAMIETQDDAMDPKQSDTGKISVLKAVRMNTEELRPLPETDCPYEANAYKGGAEASVRVLFPLLKANSATGSRGMSNCMNVILMSSTLKSMCGLLRSVRGIEVANSILDTGILSDLLKLAVNSDTIEPDMSEHGDAAITSLEALECKSLQLRQRLFYSRQQKDTKSEVVNKAEETAEDEVKPSNTTESNENNNNENEVSEAGTLEPLDLASTDEAAHLNYASHAFGLALSQSDNSLSAGAGDIAPPTAMVDELMAMGFPEEWCVTALRENHNDMVSASTWIVDNLDMLSQLRNEECDDEEDDDEDDEDDDDDDDDDEGSHQSMRAASNRLAASSDKRSRANKKGCDDLFEESFFPNDAVQDTHQYGASWYDNSTGSSFGPRQTRLMSIASKISTIKRHAVESSCRDTEYMLSALYAQQIVMDVMKLWLANREAPDGETNIVLNVESLGNFEVLLNFFKFCLSRESLIQKCDRIIPLKANSPLVVDTLKDPTTQKMMRTVLIQLFLDDANQKSTHTVSTCIAERGLRELENTLVYLETKVIPVDSEGIGSPCASFAKWLFDVIFEFEGTRSPHIDKMFKIIHKCLSSSNRRLNGILYALLSKLIFQTVDACEKGSESEQILAKKRLSQWNELLPRETLSELAKERLTLERDSGRFLMSVYLRRIMNLNIGLREMEVQLGKETLEDIVKENVPVPAPDKSHFSFDRLHCGPSIDINDDGTSATFSSSESWSTVLGNVGFMVGKNVWEIHIERSPTAYLFVGIATKDANLSTFLGGDDNGWGYIGDRALYHKRNKVKLYGERFGQGDTVGVTLDMDEGTLSFSKNGENLGVAISNLSGVLYPAVAFYNRGQRVSLLPHSFKLPGAGKEIPGSATSTKLETLVKSGALLRNYALGRKYARATIKEIYLSYKKWYYGETIRHTTLSGFDLQLDTSPKACRKFGFSVGEQMGTAMGVATVVGVANGCLWRSLENEERGIWFFSTRELGDRVKTAPLDEENNESDEVDEESLVNRMTPLEEALPVLDFESFLDFISRDKVIDNVIVKCVNDLSANGREEVNPWNITPKQFLDEVVPDVLKRRKAANKCYQETPNSFRSQRSQILDVEELCFAYMSARFALLRYVNDRIVGLFPFADMSGEYKKPLLSNALLPASSRQNEILHLDLGRMVGSVRDCIFFKSKRTLLTTVIRRTTTRAKKAEDDYDYPEDLPQVVLNRPKAVLARNKLDAETRLSYSVFGQSFDELHFLEPASLRMGYTHPMDDGQERTFKVKFEGEGVDDYGGPYREFFSQIIEELQGLQPEDMVGDGGTPMCFLPLLVPSPNHQNNVGEKQEHFVLNPSTVRSFSGSAQLYVEMYNFLGQVIGIALRSRVHLSLAFPSMLWKVMVSSPLEWADLSECDNNVCAVLKGLLHLVDDGSNSLSDANAAADILNELGWETKLSDGSITRLRPQSCTPVAKEGVVTLKDVVQYALCVVQCRLTESEPAMRALRDGMLSVVPAAVLPLLTWSELERTVCGREEIDVDLLRCNTEYDDDVSAEDEHIKWMWDILEEWDHERRRAFLRFVWARSHLPPTAKEFKQKFKVQALVGDGARNTPDLFLPKAHTCFFSINLPRYTNKKVFEEKLLYAIHNCVEMDADFRLTGNESTGWTL